MGIDPSTLRSERIRRLRPGEERPAAPRSTVIPARETIDALHAEIARLRDENDDLRASAQLWADLYQAQVKRADGGETQTTTRVQCCPLTLSGESLPVAMPENSIKATPPPACLSCGRTGTVKQQTSVKGASITLMWHCVRCGHEWPANGSSAA